MAGGIGALLNYENNKNTNVTANITRNRMTESAHDITDIFQKTSADCTNFNNISFYDCGASDMSIQQKGMCKINLKSRMSNAVNNQIQQSMTNKAKQHTKDVLQSFSIAAGTENAMNISNISNEAHADIMNRIKETCSNVTSMSNAVTCENAKGLYGNYIMQDTIADSTVSCALSDDIVNNTTQKMTAITDQYASSIQKDAITTSLIGMVLIYIASMSVGLFAVGKFIPNAILIIVALGFIFTMGFILYYDKFHVNHRPGGDRCADCTKFADQKSCEMAICKWKGDVDQRVSNTDYPSLNPLCFCDSVTMDCSNQCYLQKTSEDCKKANCGWDATNNICTGSKNICNPTSFNHL